MGLRFLAPALLSLLHALPERSLQRRGGLWLGAQRLVLAIAILICSQLRWVGVAV